MLSKIYKTTDDRFTYVGDDEWLDDDDPGIKVVPTSVVDEYLIQNPRVGICVVARRDDD